jgi:hypothetical protein
MDFVEFKYSAPKVGRRRGAGREAAPDVMPASPDKPDSKHNVIDINPKNILSGIIFSEILGKPRAKRGFHR